MIDQSEIPFRSVLVYGLGMMGSSLALALRASPRFRGRLTGVVRSERSEEYARRNGICDELIRSADESIPAPIDYSNYDLIVFGMPVLSVLRMIETFPAFGGVITDMSSTHAELSQSASKRDDLRFVGSHPMCGSENQGPSAGSAELFQDRLCIVMQEGKSSTDIERVVQFWEAIGMRSYRMDPTDHDGVVAVLSHAPHFISSAIAQWAGTSELASEHSKRSPMPLSGGGFRDMVRIAGSNPRMWTDIFQTNRRPILESLREFGGVLEGLIEMLEQNGEDAERIVEWMRDARRKRNRLCGYPEDQ